MPFQKGNKLGLLNIGRTASPETRMKMSLAAQGENNPFFGKTHSLETKKRLREKRLGKNLKPKAGYSALHTYIKRRLPKPDLCVRCKNKKPYDLSNNSGEYKRDLDDWEWLCRNCHSTKDKKVHNLKWMQQFEGKEMKQKRNCLVCDKEFMVYKSHVKRGGGTYCSHSCSQKEYLRIRWLDK